MSESNPDISPEEITGFKIYYADGFVLQGTSVQEWDVAPDGVQVVVYYTDAGPSLAHGVDRYRFPGSDVTKNGQLMATRRYEALVKRAYREA